MAFLLKVLGLAIAISAAIKAASQVVPPLEPSTIAAIAAITLPVVGLAAALFVRSRWTAGSDS